MSGSLRLFFTTLVALGLSTPLIGQPKQAVHPSSEKWPSLFNQKLDNANFPKGVWYLDENGYLTATGTKPSGPTQPIQILCWTLNTSAALQPTVA